MKKTKEFFGVLFSVLICVFLVVFIVQATTTISTNIVTEGNVTVSGTTALGGAAAATEFSVRGTASVSQELWASGSVQFGSTETTGTLSYSRFGAGTTDHSLADADDLLITGLLEVDDAAYFDSTVSVSTSLRTPTIFGNTDSGLYLRIGDAGTTNHALNAEDDLMVTGELEVDGLAFFDSFVSISDDLWASGSVQFGGDDSTGTLSYSRFGAGTTDHSLADADDLLITGYLEVDASASFDQGVSVSSTGFLMDEGITITSGTASPSVNCTQGSIYLRTGVASMGLAFNMCDNTNSWTSLASESDASGHW